MQIDYLAWSEDQNETQFAQGNSRRAFDDFCPGGVGTCETSRTRNPLRSLFPSASWTRTCDSAGTRRNYMYRSGNRRRFVRRHVDESRRRERDFRGLFACLFASETCLRLALAGMRAALRFLAVSETARIKGEDARITKRTRLSREIWMR